MGVCTNKFGMSNIHTSLDYFAPTTDFRSTDYVSTVVTTAFSIGICSSCSLTSDTARPLFDPYIFSLINTSDTIVFHLYSVDRSTGFIGLQLCIWWRYFPPLNTYSITMSLNFFSLALGLIWLNNLIIFPSVNQSYVMTLFLFYSKLIFTSYLFPVMSGM